jgi:hypothetical protein
MLLANFVRFENKWSYLENDCRFRPSQFALLRVIVGCDVNA